MEKCDQLLAAVKTAVSQNGIDGASTRVIARTAGVDDGHIYRFFKTRDEMLFAAYRQDSEALFGEIFSEIDYLHFKTSVQLQDGVRLIFHMIWKALLADPDYCSFAVYYYHSPSFQDALEFHRSQIDQLVNCTKWLFENEEKAELCMYSVLSVAFEFAKKVIDELLPNSPEIEERIFEIVLGLLMTQSGKLPIKSN